LRFAERMGGVGRQVIVGKGIRFPRHAIKDDEEAAWYVKW
jgi:hypothetical protein